LFYLKKNHEERVQQQQKATTRAVAHPHATSPNPTRPLSLATGIAPFVFLGEMIFAGVVVWRTFRWFWMVTK
jgi:hypothetical protein